MAKKFLNIQSKAFSRGRILSRLGPVSSISRSSKREHRTLPLSYFAQAGIAKACFSQVMQKRRADFEFWRQLLNEDKSIAPVFDTFPSGVCPLGFPIKFKDRDSVESRLRQKGINLAVHWRLDARLGRECTTATN